MVAKDGLDRVSYGRDGMTVAGPRRGEQDQPGMHPALRQPLSRKRPEVFDVVRDHGPAFAACDFKDDPVAAPDEILAVSNGVDVIADLAQQRRDLRR